MARSETPERTTPAPSPATPRPASPPALDPRLLEEIKEWVRRELQLVAINVPEFERREMNP